MTIISVPSALNSCHSAFISRSHRIKEICESKLGMICWERGRSKEQLIPPSSAAELVDRFSDRFPVPAYFSVSTKRKRGDYCNVSQCHLIHRIKLLCVFLPWYFPIRRGQFSWLELSTSESSCKLPFFN